MVKTFSRNPLCSVTLRIHTEYADKYGYKETQTKVVNVAVTVCISNAEVPDSNRILHIGKSD